MFADVLLLLILISIWFGFYQIVKQHGRLLLRLDALERQFAPSHPAHAEGPEVGTQFPSFSLRDLDERPVSLSDFRGKRVLLLHWNPDCGFCDLIAPDLAPLQAQIEQRGVQLLLLAHGTADANRKLAEDHGLKCPVLLYGDQQVPKPFANLGTPSAYLLDREGCLAKPVVVGSEEVPALIHEIVGEKLDAASIAADSQEANKRLPGEQPISASRIVRNGLKAGTVAPRFTLPDVNGHETSLEDYRGRRVLLVFSDPDCGPCDELAPQLARFHKQHSQDLALILIGRGEAEENRRKAEQHGIEFPVLLQHKWRLSKEYGIFSTPVAFLVDEEGVIARDVAIGRDAIMALAQEAAPMQKETEYELSYR